MLEKTIRIRHKTIFFVKIKSDFDKMVVVYFILSMYLVPIIKG